MSWPNVALGELFDIARGGSPRPIDDYITDSPDGVNWISIKDASNSSKYITSTAKKILPSGVTRSREVKPGDFLLTNSMSFGRPYILRTSGCIHDGWLLLRGDKKVIDQDYFYQLLGSDFIYRKFQSLAAGAVVKNLNIDLVKTVKVPLPPLSEQRRIAAILDKADALCAKRREAIAKLDTLSMATFYEICGSPLGPPVSIGKPDQQDADSYVPLVEVAQLATGHTPSRRVPEYWGGKIPWISLTDIRRLDGRLAEEAEQFTNEMGIANSSAVVLPEQTVCFSRTASVGFATILGREMATSQDFVNWICGERIDPFYLLAAFRASKRYLVSKSTGSTHKTIYFPVAERFHVFLPDISKQHRFAEALRKIWKLRSAMETQAPSADQFFESLQQRAFAGTL